MYAYVFNPYGSASNRALEKRSPWIPVHKSKRSDISWLKMRIFATYIVYECSSREGCTHVGAIRRNAKVHVPRSNIVKRYGIDTVWTCDFKIPHIPRVEYGKVIEPRTMTRSPSTKNGLYFCRCNCAPRSVWHGTISLDNFRVVYSKFAGTGKFT